MRTVDCTFACRREIWTPKLTKEIGSHAKWANRGDGDRMAVHDLSACSYVDHILRILQHIFYILAAVKVASISNAHIEDINVRLPHEVGANDKPPDSAEVLWQPG